MSGEISKIFTQYQQKYPMYRTDAIVDMMLDDGVITFDIAKELKSGKSLFLIDREFNLNNNPEDYTEILGGYFTRTQPKEKAETNFNRKIEPTFQSKVQGDCWLLSDINALNQTEWGRQAIYDSIVPDEDGSGGVTIKFKGSPLKEKEIHITAEEIDNARKSGNYSDGDDDMIAFELATERTFRKMVKLGLATYPDSDESRQSYGVRYRSFIHLGVKTDKFEQYPISELLGIENYALNIMPLNDRPKSKEEKDKIYRWLAQNRDNVSIHCGFGYIFDGHGDPDSKDYIKGKHDYAIKEFKYGKYVTLFDPYYSDYEIKLDWKTFFEDATGISLSFKDSKTLKQFKDILPENYDDYCKRSREFWDNLMEEHDRKFKEYIEKTRNLSYEERRTQLDSLSKAFDEEIERGFDYDAEVKKSRNNKQ